MRTIPIPEIKLGAIAPEITLTVFAVILLLAEVFAEKKGKDRLGYMALAGVVLAGALIPLGGEPWTAFSGLYAVDNFASFFKLVFLLGAGLTILISVVYNQEEGVDSGEYYALLLFATAGMFFMASGADMMTIFMGLEVMSISLYVLAGYTRTRRASNESSLKYFILGALSSGFLLYGMALVYGATGSTSLSKIGEAVATGTGNDVILGAGVVLIVMGFAFKVAAVPFHMWTPDVYQGAPLPVTAFMSAGPKAAAFAAFLRVLAEAFPALSGQWWELLWVLAAATMIVGNVIALVQDDVKRMLAYSSIAHAGYALVGLTAASEAAASGILFYMLVYTFMNIGAFAVVAAVAGKGEKRATFADYTGLGFSNPLLAATLSLFLFSLAGIPPTAGFTGKFYIFMAALEEGFVVLAVLAALNSVVSVFYYLRLTVVMYMRGEEGQPQPVRITAPVVVALAVSAYGALWLGINPAGYIAFAKSAFLSF